MQKLLTKSNLYTNRLSAFLTNFKSSKLFKGVYPNKLYICCTLCVVTIKITLKIDVAVVELQLRIATSFHDVTPPPHFDVSQGCWLLIAIREQSASWFQHFRWRHDVADRAGRKFKITTVWWEIISEFLFCCFFVRWLRFGFWRINS